MDSVYYLADFYKSCNFSYNNPCMYRTIREVASDTAIGNASIGQRKRKGKMRQNEVRETKAEDIKVKITFTPGYQQRFTEACLRQLERRQKHQELQNTAPWKTDKDSMPKVSA